jgi:hypothetical protein
MARHLVYTSAGDRARLEPWLRGRSGFDLWITYYGERGERWRELADHYDRRRGGKFPNLHHHYQTRRADLDAYDAILVMDDDIEIEGRDIERLFRVREEYDLWLCQPAFHPRGRISIGVTALRARTRLRFTDFVEVTCPLFRKDKLDAFMAVYDPQLVGWGVDWWFCELIGGGPERRIAVVDAIPCTNPRDRGGGVREIDLLQSEAERKAAWERVKAERGLGAESRGAHVFGGVPRPWPAAARVALELWAMGHVRRRRRRRRRLARQRERMRRA